MLFLIFPKKFEFSLFLSKLRTDPHKVVFYQHFDTRSRFHDLTHYLHQNVKNVETYLLCIRSREPAKLETQKADSNRPSADDEGTETKKKNTQYYWFLSAVINESDISFSNIFSNYLSNVYNICRLEDLETPTEEMALFESFHFVLCGTCGGCSNMSLGECFCIARATKFDRGDMVVQEGAAYVSLGNPLTCSCSPYFPVDSESRAHTFSSNFLFRAEPKELSKYSVEFEAETVAGITHYLAEMETFEFFTACTALHATSFGALRVVSDVYCKKPELDLIGKQCEYYLIKIDDKYSQEDNLLHRVGRKSVDMTGLINSLMAVFEKLDGEVQDNSDSSDGNEFTGVSDYSCEDDYYYASLADAKMLPPASPDFTMYAKATSVAARDRRKPKNLTRKTIYTEIGARATLRRIVSMTKSRSRKVEMDKMTENVVESIFRSSSDFIQEIFVKFDKDQLLKSKAHA